jgi:hypothetical protein
VSKKSETHLYNVTMFALDNAVLLMGVRERNLMRYAKVTKKGIKFLVLPTPIRLDSKNLGINPSLNKTLKFKEIFKHLRFGAKQIKSGEFARIIYETNIIFLAAERINNRTTHI